MSARVPGTGGAAVSAPIVEVRAASFGYGATPALRDVSFSARSGELVDPSINPALPLDQVEPMLDTLKKQGLDLRGTVLPALGGLAAFVRGDKKGAFEGGAVKENRDVRVRRGRQGLDYALGRMPEAEAGKGFWRSAHIERGAPPSLVPAPGGGGRRCGKGPERRQQSASVLRPAGGEERVQP